MYHRGPDDDGIYLHRSVGLAHRRLSIIDLSEAGRQPMTNEDSTIFLVCNGEIYNYLELKEDLIKKGHKFLSESDSEVIIHQYEEIGEHCLDTFNGMFAFLLWDIGKQRLFGARDRLGIKPLYYFVDEKKIILASEIKAIIENPNVPRKPDYKAISDYLFAGRALGNKSMFEGIKELEPGHMLSVDKATEDVQIKKYWDVSYNYNFNRSDISLIDELSWLLDDAVRIRCRSDALLGCHLSGGLDSSTVVAMASKYRKPLKAFSIKFSEDDRVDESEYAKAVADHVGAEYYEYSPTATDLQTLFAFLLWHMDVPMANVGGFSYYAVSHLARQYAKVSLTGHGGDELFAGYPAQFMASYNTTDMFTLHEDSYVTGKRSLLARIGEKLIYDGPKGFCSSIKNRFSKSVPSFEDVWIQLHCGYIPQKSPSLHERFLTKLQGYSPKVDYISPLTVSNTEEILDRCLYHDLKVYLPSLLHLEDRASMSQSIESRVPLLDFRIVEFLATVPPKQKVKCMEPKYLLRRISSSILPEKVWKRKDKFPFPVPEQMWFSCELNDLTKQILLSKRSLARGIFKPYILRDACRNVISPWPLMNVELWFKLFIDQDPIWLGMVHPSEARSASC